MRKEAATIDFLQEGVYDYVSLWEFRRGGARLANRVEEMDARETTLDLIGTIVSEGWMVAGQFEFDETRWRVFDPLEKSASELVDHIENRWQLETEVRFTRTVDARIHFRTTAEGTGLLQFYQRMP